VSSRPICVRSFCWELTSFGPPESTTVKKLLGMGVTSKGAAWGACVGAALAGTAPCRGVSTIVRMRNTTGAAEKLRCVRTVVIQILLRNPIRR